MIDNSKETEDCGGCKEEIEPQAEICIQYEQNADLNVIQNVLENRFGYSATRVSTAVKFMNNIGECMIYTGNYKDAIEHAQVLMNLNVKHIVRYTKLLK